jgi:hypothetical protein
MMGIVVDEVGDSLHNMEEPFLDADGLVQAALMAAGAITDKVQRAAIRAVLDKTTLSIEEALDHWREALAARRGDTGHKKKTPPWTLTMVES